MSTDKMNPGKRRVTTIAKMTMKKVNPFPIPIVARMAEEMVTSNHKLNKIPIHGMLLRIAGV